MFTGLIESVGRVARIARASPGIRLSIDTPLASELSAGDSLSVNGVCLTAIDPAGTTVHADIGPETARVTTLGGLRENQAVNLERPMRADGRFGGHFVQGHVDGAGSVRNIRADGDANWVTIAFPGALAPFFIPKGSVAIDGISLTVAALRDEELDVMIVPFTWQHTNLRSRQIGDAVNLECDMIGKYVARIAALQVPGATPPGR
jgi:riboflavin synthase